MPEKQEKCKRKQCVTALLKEIWSVEVADKPNVQHI